MKVTYIDTAENCNLIDTHITYQFEKNEMRELSVSPRGRKAKRIKIELEYTLEDFSFVKEFIEQTYWVLKSNKDCTAKTVK